MEELEDLDVSSLSIPKPERRNRTGSVGEESVKKIDLDKEALLRMLSAKMKVTSTVEGQDIANALENFVGKDPKRLSGKKSNSAPKLINPEEDQKKKARSSLERRRKDDATNQDQRITTPRGDESSKSSSQLVGREATASPKSNRSSVERKQVTPEKPTKKESSSVDSTEPSMFEPREDEWKSKRQSNPSFWENSVSAPATPTQDIPAPPFKLSGEPSRTKSKPPKIEIPNESSASILDDIDAAIESLNAPPQEEPKVRQPIARTVSTWYVNRKQACSYMGFNTN